MKKYEIVKQNADFNDIINTGLCLRSHYYNIYYKDEGNNYAKFGLAVSKKCGNAVERNKIKRRLRYIIDKHKKMFQKKHNYIIMVKKGILDITFQEMEKNLVETMERIRNEEN